VCARIRGCEYEREDKKPCNHHERYGKFVWKDPDTGEEKYYCIFHVPIEVKKDLRDVFWERFGAYVNETREEFDKAGGEGRKRISLDCEGFVFPGMVENDLLLFKTNSFPFKVIFRKAIFTGYTLFTGIAFEYYADFYYTVFKDNVSFIYSAFSGVVNFCGAVFCGEANFHQTSFIDNVFIIFNNAKFFGRARFGSAEMTKIASFQAVYFRRMADFRKARLKGGIDFCLSNFCGDAFFQAAEIGESSDNTTANFGGAFFASEVNFERAKFLGRAIFGMSKKLRNFRETTFAGKVVFNEALFNSNAGLYHCVFEDEVQLERVIFDIPFPGAADFGDTAFRKRVTFLDARFNCWTRFLRTEFGGETVFKNTEFLDKTDFVEINKNLKERVQESETEIKLEAAMFYKPDRVQINNCEMYHWSFASTDVEGVRFIDADWPERASSIGGFLSGAQGRKVIYDEEIAGEEEKTEEKEGADNAKKDGGFWEKAEQVYRRLRLNYENQLDYAGASDFHWGQLFCRSKSRDIKFWEKIFNPIYRYTCGYGESIYRPLISLIVIIGILIKTLGFELTVKSLFNFGVINGLCLWQSIIYQLGRVAAVIFATFFVLALRRRFKR
jgi:uncharacterized protein YjbI with pentapeptide repeats